jgi:hypothetical protein
MTVAMDMIGIDLHKRESQLCVLSADDVTETRIATTRARFGAVLRHRRLDKLLLIEAGTRG